MTTPLRKPVASATLPKINLSLMRNTPKKDDINNKTKDTKAATATTTKATAATSTASTSTAASASTAKGSTVARKRVNKYNRTARNDELRDEISFLYYPEKDSSDYQKDLYRKWEFLRSKVSDNFAETKIEDLCGIKKVLWPYQEFLRNFLSKETPYNGALLWHGVGTGKTCGSVTIAEGLRNYIEAAKKNVYIIAPSQVEENFKNELYSFTNEKKEQSEGLDPGSLQCTGLTYYLPPVGRDKEKARKSAIRARMSENRSVYKFFGIGTKFPNYVTDLKDNYRIDIGEWFSNSLFIIDEAHRIVTKDGIKQDSDSGEKKGRKKKNIDDNDSDSDLDIGSDSELSEELTDDSDTETLESKKGRGRSKGKGKGKDKVKRGKGKKKEGENEDDIPSPKLLPTLKEILKNAQNTKVIFLTATPIHDDPHEIVEIINLLRINDKEPELIDANKLFKVDVNDPTIPAAEKIANIDKDYFNRMTKGYISYIRGENPVSFPEVKVPEDSYTPHCLIDITGEKFINPIPLNVNLGLVRCSMDSDIQYSAHQEFVHPSSGAKANRGMIHLGVMGRQITTVVYPNAALNGLPFVGNRSGFYRVFGKNNQPGPINLSKEKKSFGKGKRVITQFKWIGGTKPFTNNIVGNNMQFLLEENIYPYSTKFNAIFNNIQDENRGITFIYSSFVESGAISAAMFLEANGFVRYHHEDSFKRNAAGKYDDYAAPYPLISYQSYKDNNMPRRYRCYRCCKLDTDEIHTNTGLGPDGKVSSNPNYGTKGSSEADDPQGFLPHKFEQGVYSLYLHKNTKLRDEEGDIIRSTENKFGKRIKFLIGSKIIGEGVNLFNVRQVHLLDPWHNNTVSYQARGRAIRNCSHKELPPNMRYVMIYEYCATVPDYFEGQEKYTLNVVEKYLDGNKNVINQPVIVKNKNLGITAVPLLTETIDEEIFRRAWGKDVIIKYLERLAKINAFDCNLFKALNYFPKTDKPYTRQCDYLECDFECAWEPSAKDLADPDFINYDTYNLFFSKTQVDRAIQTLREIFKRYPGGLQIDDILQLVRKVDPNIEEEYVYQALDEMLGDPPGRLPIQLIDRMGRNGKLVYQGSAYIFQPNDIKDELAPIRYRLKPLQIKHRSAPFAVSEKAEEIKQKIVAKEVDYQNLAISKLKNLISKYVDDESINEIKPYEIEKTLDSLNQLELLYFFQNLFMIKSTDINMNIFKGIVIEYLAKRFMLLLSTNIKNSKTKQILGLIDENFQSSLINEQNLTGTKYAIVGDRIEGTEMITVNANNNLVFTPIDSEDPIAKQAINTMQDLATDNDLSGVAYGFYDETVGKFKISYTANEQITFNEKSDKINRKSISAGKVITYYKQPVLVGILDQLKELLADNSRYDLDHINSSSLNITELSIAIEQALRILDMASAQEAIETGDPSRIKYILYPYQHREGCRSFTFETLPNGEIRGRHMSKLKTSSTLLNIDRCSCKAGVDPDACKK